jgi:hypothetical protein
VGQRTGVINQIRGFLIERGITVRQGAVPLRKVLPDILSSNTDVLSPRMVRLIADLRRTGVGWQRNQIHHLLQTRRAYQRRRSTRQEGIGLQLIRVKCQHLRANAFR